MGCIIGVVHDCARTASHVGGVALPVNCIALFQRSNISCLFHCLNQAFTGHFAGCRVKGHEIIMKFGRSGFVGTRGFPAFSFFEVRRFFLQCGQKHFELFTFFSFRFFLMGFDH